MFKYSKVENIIIQLTVISKLCSNEKICINNTSGRISVISGTKLSAIYRWINGENRSKCIHFINNLVNDALDILLYNTEYNNEKEKFITIDYYKQLKNAMNHSCAGFEQLKLTYVDDMYMVSYLESIINKINTSLQNEKDLDIAV